MASKLVLAVLVGTVATTSFAGGGKSASYKQLDADKDGYISQQEGGAVPILERNWTAIDINQDGQLDTAEFARFETALGRSTPPRESAPEHP